MFYQKLFDGVLNNGKNFYFIIQMENKSEIESQQE